MKASDIDRSSSRGVRIDGMSIGHPPRHSTGRD
jgi:hypothetical protein